VLGGTCTCGRFAVRAERFCGRRASRGSRSPDTLIRRDPTPGAAAGFVVGRSVTRDFDRLRADRSCDRRASASPRAAATVIRGAREAAGLAGCVVCPNAAARIIQ